MASILSWPQCVNTYHNKGKTQGPVSVSDKSYCCKILQSLKAARFVLRLYDPLRFNRHLSSSAADVPVKFLSDAINYTTFVFNSFYCP